MSHIKKYTIDVTAVDILVPVGLGDTGLLGGAGREGRLTAPASITAVYTIQGHNGSGEPTFVNGQYVEGRTPPDEADTGWYDILDVTAATPVDEIVEDLPRWLRVDVTTADVDGPEIDLTIETTP